MEPYERFTIIIHKIWIVGSEKKHTTRERVVDRYQVLGYVSKALDWLEPEEWIEIRQG